MDPRVTRDINKLSTGDLVVCWTILAQQMEYARSRGDRSMADEFSARLRAIDAELAHRQGELFEDPPAAG